MEERLAVIEEKIEGVGSLIRDLACFGSKKSAIDAGQLQLLVQEMDALQDRLQTVAATTLPKQPFYNVKEAAILLKLSEGEVRKKLREGKLKGKRVESLREDGKDPWSISYEAIEEYKWQNRKPKD